MYLSIFYVHLSLLTNSGTGDTFMSPAFQETLKGNELLLNSQGQLEQQRRAKWTQRPRTAGFVLCLRTAQVEECTMRRWSGQMTSQGHLVRARERHGTAEFEPEFTSSLNRNLL